MSTIFSYYFVENTPYFFLSKLETLIFKTLLAALMDMIFLHNIISLKTFFNHSHTKTTRSQPANWTLQTFQYFWDVASRFRTKNLSRYLHHSGKNGKKMHGSTVLIISAMDGELVCRKNTFTLECILDLDFLVWIYDFQYLCSQFCFKIKKTASDFNCLNFCCIFLTKLEVLINIFI